MAPDGKVVRISTATADRARRRPGPHTPVPLPTEADGFIEVKPKGPVAADRWTEAIIKAGRGYIPVARAFLRNYSELNIRPNEAMFIIHLMDFKRRGEAPWPRYKRLAEYMGLTRKQVQRLAASLEGVGLLRRERRDATSNRFHLEGVLKALEKLIAEGKARK